MNLKSQIHFLTLLVLLICVGGALTNVNAQTGGGGSIQEQSPILERDSARRKCDCNERRDRSGKLPNRLTRLVCMSFRVVAG